MKQLGRCAEHLRKAVRYLALSSGTPQEKLTSMFNDTGFGSIHKDDFPKGPLKDDFQTITGSLIKASEPQVVVNIRTMTDEQARKVIGQICELSDDVAYALGGQTKST
jgi:hypothetical protein